MESQLLSCSNIIVNVCFLYFTVLQVYPKIEDSDEVCYSMFTSVCTKLVFGAFEIQ